MSRLPIHTLTSAPEQTRPILQKLQARSGTLMNIHATMANSPAVLGAYAAMNAAIAKETTFDARTREAIALTVANADGCDYCQGAHTMLAKKAGLSEADTFAFLMASVFTNYFNHYVRTDQDVPAAPSVPAS